jgi:hypothetical protein
LNKKYPCFWWSERLSTTPVKSRKMDTLTLQKLEVFVCQKSISFLYTTQMIMAATVCQK